MTWKDIKQCASHGLNHTAGCMSCNVAIDWVVWRQLCACGDPAVGYTFAPGEDLKFYCDDHFPVYGPPKSLDLGELVLA